MSHSATMFSALTSCRSAAARLATPIMPILSLSFGESFRACACTLTSQAPVAAAVCLMNWRRFRAWVISREFLSRQFANVNVTEPDRLLVRLEFDLAARVNRFIAFPVVFHSDIVHHQLVIEIDRHFVADHENIEMVPLARKIVRHLQWVVGILLIVEKPAGAFVVRIGFAAERVPDLHLGTAPQINAAVSAFIDLPVHLEFEVAVVFTGAKVVEHLPSIYQRTVTDLPVLTRQLVGFLLGGREFCCGQLCAFRGSFYQSFPTRPVYAVK